MGCAVWFPVKELYEREINICTKFPCDLRHATRNYCESNPKTCQVLMPSQAWNGVGMRKAAILYTLSTTSILHLNQMNFSLQETYTKTNSLPEPQIDTAGYHPWIKSWEVKFPFCLGSFKVYQNNGIFSFCTISNSIRDIMSIWSLLFVRPRIGWGTFAATLYKWSPIQSW